MKKEIWDKRAEKLRPYSGIGLSISEVSKKVGFNKITVRTYADRYGFVFNGHTILSRSAMHDSLRVLAAEGKTREEVAAELGVSYATINRWGAALGVEFVHGSALRGATERSEAMAAMYTGGKTLEEIGTVFGITRERVRQIIKKHHGLTGHDGGLYRAAERKRALKRAAREAKCLDENGCTYEQLRSLRKLAEDQVAAGVPPYRTPIKAFSTQKRNAIARGIEWNLKLWDWWTLWQESGKWEQRGRGRGYMMCRFGDTGPYEIGNVYIATGVHNGKIQPNNPYRADHPRHDEVIHLLRNREGGARQCSNKGCDGKHYAHGLCQKHYARLRYLNLKASSDEGRAAA